MESLYPGIVSAVTALIAYMTYDTAKDLPFQYITQTDHALCHWMNGTFCGRISYLIMALLVYGIYTVTTKFVSIPVKNGLQDSLRNGLSGVGIGTGIALMSIEFNLLFGFIELKGIDYEKFVFLPVILLGMLMTGFTEELMFRALPINALRAYVPESLLVIGTALLFGFVHLQYSVYYGFAAFVTGLLLGYGFLKYGLFWASGFHTAFNTVETSFYSVMKYKVNNPSMAGERKTPDDDGVLTSIIEAGLFGLLKYTGYL